MKLSIKLILLGFDFKACFLASQANSISEMQKLERVHSFSIGEWLMEAKD